MSKMYDDYDKVVKVIHSCKTNSQNQIAYRMCWNWNAMYKDSPLFMSLIIMCDESLINIMGSCK